MGQLLRRQALLLYYHKKNIMKKITLIALVFACISSYASTSSSESAGTIGCDASSTASCKITLDDAVIYSTGKYHITKW